MSLVSYGKKDELVAYSTHTNSANRPNIKPGKTPNADLHLHSTFSDGNSQAEALIEEAISFGLKAIAITDHDNAASYNVALKAAEGTDIEIIPGIEINTVWDEEDCELHVLGFYIDREHPALQKVMTQHQEARHQHMQDFAKALRKQAGFDITYEEIKERAGHCVSLGRPHIANVLVEKGKVSSINEAFNKYLNRKAKTYARKQTVSPHEAVEAIADSGGIPVIAHPGDTPNIEKLTVELMDYGLRGLEAYHRSHTPGVIAYYCTLAEQYGLIVTGGTDYHGKVDGYQQALGRLHTPHWVLDELRNEHQRSRKAKFKLS